MTCLRVPLRLCSRSKRLPQSDELGSDGDLTHFSFHSLNSSFLSILLILLLFLLVLSHCSMELEERYTNGKSSRTPQVQSRLYLPSLHDVVLECSKKCP
jgi:hypothetical protein